MNHQPVEDEPRYCRMSQGRLYPLEKTHIAHQLFLFLAFFILWVLAGWPGFMNADSYWMMLQAAGVVTDGILSWHTPALTYLWGILAASTLGPIGPYLLQGLFFWSGIFFFSLWLKARKSKFSRWVFPAVLFVPEFSLTWFITKDSAIVSLISLGFGLFLASQLLEKKLLSQLTLFSGVFAFALAATVRWYVAPALLILSLALMPRVETRKEIRRNVLKSVAVFSAVLVGVSTFTQQIIRPVDENPETSVMVLDHLRVECVPPRNASQPSELVYTPANLVSEWPAGHSLCDSFDPFRLANYRLWSPVEAPKFKQVLTNDEASALRDSWIQLWLNHFDLLVENRFDMMVDLLMYDSYTYSLGVSSTFSGLGAWPIGNSLSPEPWLHYAPNSVPGGISNLSSEFGFERFSNSGNLITVLMSAPSQFFPAGIPFVPLEQRGFVWIILVPLAAWSYERFRRQSRRSVLLLFVPIIYSTIMISLAAADNFRYIVPAVFIGFFGTFSYLAFGKEREFSNV